MRLSVIALSACSAFLAGCDKASLFGDDEKGRFASLHFDAPVDKLYTEVGRKPFALYPDNVVEALRSLGIPVEGLDFKLAKKDSSTIHVAIKDPSFDLDQQKALKSAFSSILEAKQRSVFRGHVKVDVGSPDFKAPNSQLYEQSDNGVYIHPSTDLRVTIKYNTEGLYDLLRSHGNSEFYCHISSEIKHDLPFQLAVQMSDQIADASGYFDTAVRTWSYKPVKVAIRFDDPNVSRLLSEGKLNFALNSQRSSGAVNEISVQVGSLGIHNHNVYKMQEFGKLSSENYAYLESKCQSMAATLGRPFTFHFGDGLDRLKSVVYTEQPTG